ncbi:MAG: asparagine synthase-related protein, partial [Thermodesulfobacteriota bacterium]
DSHATELFRISQPWPNVDVTMTRLICDTYLRENGIAQGDRLSMASSVELRLPLVDHRLVETVVGLRKAQSDLHLPPKAWLKAAVADLLPAWVLDRPKRGFAPPVKEWHKALFCAYGESLSDGYLVQTGVLKPEAGRDLAQGPFPRGAITPISFKALVLEQWCRRMSSLA